MNHPPRKQHCCKATTAKFLQIFLALLIVATISFSYYFSAIQSYDDTNNTLIPKTFFTSSSQSSRPEENIHDENIRDDLSGYGGVRYHVVFSTGCSEQQHWESYVFFYHAYKVRQPGNITRLVSGCTPQEEKRLRRYHGRKIATMSDRFHIHFTPEYSNVATAQPYKYYNKPCGLHHWMTNVLHMDQHPKAFEDDIIILADPDFILLRPIFHDTRNNTVHFVQNHPITKVVKHGMPIAQQDGYLYNDWMRFNISYITGGGNISHVSREDGPRFYNTGPPYLATVGDMYRIATLWKEYVPRVYEEHPEIFAEMFGYIIATTQLNLPHTLVSSFVVSTTETNNREGWNMVDSLPQNQVCNMPSQEWLPHALHYCQRYILGKWFFSKYRLKKNFLSCETPLLTHPPLDSASRYDYWIRPPPDRGATHTEAVSGNLTKKRSKREAFMLCGLISKVNEAARYYKAHHCRAGANMNETYNFHDDPYST